MGWLGSNVVAEQLLDGDLFGELLWVVLNLDDLWERIVLYRIHLARVVVAGPVGALFGAGAPEGRPARSRLRPGSPCRTRGSEPMTLRRDAGSPIFQRPWWRRWFR